LINKSDKNIVNENEDSDDCLQNEALSTRSKVKFKKDEFGKTKSNMNTCFKRNNIV
jgi:hypothetical protein